MGRIKLTLGMVGTEGCRPCQVPDRTDGTPARRDRDARNDAMPQDPFERVLRSLSKPKVRPWWETTRYACPDCYAPIKLPKRGRDARCQRCRRSQDNLPVNYER